MKRYISIGILAISFSIAYTAFASQGNTVNNTKNIPRAMSAREYKESGKINENKYKNLTPKERKEKLDKVFEYLKKRKDLSKEITTALKEKDLEKAHVLEQKIIIK